MLPFLTLFAATLTEISLFTKGEMSVCGALIHEAKAKCSAGKRSYSDGCPGSSPCFRSRIWHVGLQNGQSTSQYLDRLRSLATQQSRCKLLCVKNYPLFVPSQALLTRASWMPLTMLASRRQVVAFGANTETCNGRFRIGKHTYVMRHTTETGMGRRILENPDLFGWLVMHAAATVNGFRAGLDGKTLNELRLGKNMRRQWRLSGRKCAGCQHRSL